MGSTGRKILFWLIGVAAAILILLAFIPTILSTGWGRDLVIGAVNKQIPGHVTAKELSLSWFGKQEVGGVTYSGRLGIVTATAERVTIGRSLVGLAWSGLQTGAVELEKGQVAVPGAQVDIPQLTVDHPRSGGPLTIKGNGTINDRPFKLDLDIERFTRGSLLNALRTAKGEWVTPNLPVGAIDRLLDLKGKLTEIIGRTADVDIKIEPSRLTGKIIGPLLAANVEVSPTEATLSAIGQVLNIPATHLSIGERIVLDAPTTLSYKSLRVDVDKLDLPIKEWRSGSGHATVSAKQFPLKEGVVIDSLELEIDAPRLDGGTVDARSIVTLKDNRLLPYELPIELDGQFAIDKRNRVTLPHLRISVKARNLLVNFTGSYTAKGQFELLSPMHIHYDVFPEILPRPDVLLKPFEVKTFFDPGTISVEELTLKGLKVKGTYTSTDIHLADGTLSEVAGNYSLNIPANKATFTFSANSTAGDESGKAKIDLTLSNFYKNGQIEWQNANVTATAKFHPLPVSAVMLLAGTPHRVDQIRALLGRRADVDATAALKAMNGPVKISLTSDNTRADLSGKIEDQALTLTAPLTASITVTPEIGTYFLSDFNPLFVTAARGESPITLRIDPNDFRLTRHASGLQIGSATLDPGKLWVQNSGTIQGLLSLFKRSQLNEQKEVLVWSTPIHFSARDGLLTYQRADMVIGTSLQVAYWGTANLSTNALHMTLAIPGYSLRKVLGIGDIPDDRYLLIPVRGTLDDSSIDYATALARVAALLARKEGTAGKVVGAVLDTTVGGLAKPSDVPPPTTQPYPWANDPTYRFPPPEATPQEPKKALKKEAVKQAGKQLKKLLK